MSCSLKMSTKSRLALGGINGDINVTAGAQRISFAGQPLCIERNAMLVSGIQFAAGKHELHLLQQYRECLVKME